MRLPNLLVVLNVLFIVALIGCNSAEQNKTKSIAAGSPATATPGDGARRVTVKELQDLVANNQAFIVDVRNEASYNAGHIRGARLILETDLPNHLNELPKDKLIVTYCS